MSMPRAPIQPAVYVFLLRGDEVFILKRCNTSYCDGYWNFPAGHVEREEFPVAAAIREVWEEAGVRIQPENFTFKCVQHRICEGELTYVDYFFVAQEWEGEPRNVELERASDAMWCSIHALPDMFVPSQKAAFLAVLEGQTFKEYIQTGK